MVETARLCPRCLRELAALALPDLGAQQLAAGVVAVAAYAYEGVARAALLGVKDGGRFAAAPALGELLRTGVGLPGADSFVTTWVPSPPARRRARGVEVPRMLAGRGAVRLLESSGTRVDQTLLDARARRRNMRGAFRAVAPVPPAVILVDDIRTTGATATSAALTLRESGAARVLVATFCAAVLS